MRIDVIFLYVSNEDKHLQKGGWIKILGSIHIQYMVRYIYFRLHTYTLYTVTVYGPLAVPGKIHMIHGYRNQGGQRGGPAPPQ